MPYYPSLRESFMEKWQPEPNTGCWLWTGWSACADGYGSISRRIGNKDKILRAHRVSYELFKGPVPAGLFVLHQCDTPACVNPAHLFLGTSQDNASDKVRRGRAERWRNHKHPSLKLSNEQVKELRRLSKTMRTCELAKHFGIAESTASQLKNRRVRNED